MNNLREPIAPAVATQSAEAFAHYLENTASRIDVKTEAHALQVGARVGISRPHESAHLPVLLEHAWLIASLESHAARIRSAHVLLALLTRAGEAASRHLDLDAIVVAASGGLAPEPFRPLPPPAMRIALALCAWAAMTSC